MVLQHTGFRDIMTMSESKASELGETVGVTVKLSCIELVEATECQENTEVSTVYNTILYV